MTWAEFIGTEPSDDQERTTYGLRDLQAQWPNFYSVPRVEVIWGWVQVLPAEWWSKTVKKFLGTFSNTRSGPLAEIEQEAMRAKDEWWQRLKAKSGAESEKAWSEMPDWFRRRYVPREMPKDDDQVDESKRTQERIRELKEQAERLGREQQGEVQGE